MKKQFYIRSVIACLFLIYCSNYFASSEPNANELVLRDIPVVYQILETEDETISIKDILKPEWQTKFQDPTNFSKTSPFKYYWFKVNFKEHDLSQATGWALFSGFYDEMVLYYKGKDAFASRKSGSLHANTDDTLNIREELLFFPNELIDGNYLYIRMRNVRVPWSFPQPSLYYSSLSASTFYNNFLSSEEITPAIPTFLFIGGMVVMMFYSFGIFFLYRDKTFLYYSFYLLTLVLYLGRKTITFTYFYDFPRMDYIFNEAIQVFVNIAYLTFILSFINAKKDYLLLNKVSKYVIAFLFLFIIGDIVLLSKDIFSPFQFYLINFERYFMTLFAIGGILYIFFTLKDKTALFIITGSAFFIGGALMGLLLTDVRWMMLGATIEIFIFALGLGYRFQRIQKEKQRIKREMDKVRLTALKAQMNPHFIFNSLNSIRSYIIVNETKQASNYLTKFSKLIRLILEYASTDYVTLKEEIAALKLYVELEQMRFREQFDFTIEVDPRLDLEKVQIPPLLFQPYIENAIWHGLTPKSGEKAVSLTIIKENNEIFCTIRDNGVGRNYAKKTGHDPDKKSMALSLTLDRINLINPDSNKKNVSIEDLMIEGRPAGTEVKLVLPLIINAA